MTTGLVGQHQLTPFTAPVPGDPLNATVVLGNDNDTVTAYDAHDDDSTIHFQSSVLASRPPASIAGQKWLTTDAAARYLYYDTGSAWVEVNYFRDSGGIITGAVTISDTTESTSTTTGALIVSGGVGIAKNVFIGGTLGVTGVATLTAQPIISSLTASKPVFTDASKGLVSTGTLGTDQGGTNLTTYTAGDILYASATNVLSKLAIGTTGQHLIVTAGLPAWGTDTALGTVTSVGWTGGLVSVATATTTPAFTVAGTSGGVVYFSSASTWASSAALTQYGVVYGGGAGATPVATAAGTTGQVLTAVTSGAPVWSATYAGTVTSVGFTGGLISVASATTTPALTVAGTSGGVVYFSSASTWASSAALTASAIVLGGGAGAAPATTTTGTGVVTALGINVGTAGAFVVNGGALGTPSSGAVAASLITAGTFGAGAYTFPGALAITGALTGVTTGAFSGAVSTGVLTASANTIQVFAVAASGETSATIGWYPSSASASNRNWAFSVYDEAVGDACLRVSNASGGNPVSAGTAIINWNATRMSMRQNIVFGTDNTYDIGGTVSTLRPRDLFLGRNQTIGGTLAVTGAATFSSTLGVTGATTLSSTLAVTGQTTFGSNQYVHFWNTDNTNEVYCRNEGVSGANNTAFVWSMTNLGEVLRLSNTAGAGKLLVTGALAVTGAVSLGSTITASSSVAGTYRWLAYNSDNGTTSVCDFTMNNSGGGPIGAIRAFATGFTTSNYNVADAYQVIAYRESLSLVAENDRAVNVWSGTRQVAGFDKTATATHTAMQLYDVDSGTLVRVTVGTANSGGVGFKVLRIPN